jgi:hypothetical protein
MHAALMQLGCNEEIRWSGSRSDECTTDWPQLTCLANFRAAAFLAQLPGERMLHPASRLVER